MNIAIILSAGSGSRFGSNIPKQFINLAGKNIIEYTIKAFEQNNLIDEICVVADEKFHSKIWDISKSNNFTKVQKIIAGGKERKDSSYEAIKAYEDKEDINLIFHDGVRPFVSDTIITDTIKALERYNAIDVAIPTADTIIKVKDNIINSIPNRAELQRGQTPQAFKLDTIKKAHILSNQDKTKPLFTDDCGLVKQYLKDKVYVVAGEEQNIKITYPSDLLLAEKLIQLNSITLNTNTNYEKLKDKVIVVFGGSSGIGLDIVNIATNYGAEIVSYSTSNKTDIKNIDDIKKALEDTFNQYNKIDVIINTAATLTKKELISMNDDDITNEITTNFTASVNIAKYSYKYLKQTKGSLILFTSSSYTRGRANYSLYSSTKAAIVNFAEAISSEWLEDNIKVNVINPARTATPMRIKHFGKEDESTLLKSEDVAYKTLDVVLEDFSGLVVDVK
jgi:2-C-methyl-D-erythritol 4-phosphate cytidylyltransferase